MNSSPFDIKHFVKATRSEKAGQDCVQVARDGHDVEVRHSKTEVGSRQDVRLRLPAQAFDAFQDVVRAVDLRDVDAITADTFHGLSLTVARIDSSAYALCTFGEDDGQPSRIALVYTRAEIEAFFDGIHAREFDAPTVAENAELAAV